MKTKKQIEEKIEEARKLNRKYMNSNGQTDWGIISFIDGLKWVLKERSEK